LWGVNGQVFEIILNKTVALKDVKIAGRDGELLQCWDLFVGQKIDVLGNQPPTNSLTSKEVRKQLRKEAGKEAASQGRS
jgi:hypothetical protein